MPRIAVREYPTQTMEQPEAEKPVAARMEISAQLKIAGRSIGSIILSYWSRAGICRDRRALQRSPSARSGRSWHT